MAAQLEDEKFVDRKYGRLTQLNFGKSSEVKLIDDDFKLESDEPEEDERAAKGSAKQVMLQDVVDGKADGNALQINSANAWFKIPTRAAACKDRDSSPPETGR